VCVYSLCETVLLTFNPLTPTVAMVSIRVPGCQKLQMTALPGLVLYTYVGNVAKYSCVVCFMPIDCLLITLRDLEVI